MGREIALDGLNEQSLTGINHTRTSDASVIFQRLTLLLVQGSKGPLLTSNLNICHILNLASPLAIFRHFCHSRQNRLSPSGV